MHLTFLVGVVRSSIDKKSFMCQESGFGAAIICEFLLSVNAEYRTKRIFERKSRYCLRERSTLWAIAEQDLAAWIMTTALLAEAKSIMFFLDWAGNVDVEWELNFICSSEDRYGNS